MPQIHEHPLEVVAASIATESKPPQTIVAPISIIGETTAPRLRRASHISPLTMLVSFVCGWISMPASADDDAPATAKRSRLQTSYENASHKFFGEAYMMGPIGA